MRVPGGGDVPLAADGAGGVVPRVLTGVMSLPYRQATNGS